MVLCLLSVSAEFRHTSHLASAEEIQLRIIASRNTVIALVVEAQQPLTSSELRGDYEQPHQKHFGLCTLSEFTLDAIEAEIREALAGYAYNQDEEGEYAHR